MPYGITQCCLPSAFTPSRSRCSIWRLRRDARLSWSMVCESGPAVNCTRDMWIASPTPYRWATTQHVANWREWSQPIHRCTSDGRCIGPLTPAPWHFYPLVSCRANYTIYVSDMISSVCCNGCQLDGLIARNFANQTSALGSIIDPLADKLLVSVLYVSLTYVHLLPRTLSFLFVKWWFFAHINHLYVVTAYKFCRSALSCAIRNETIDGWRFC